MRETRSTTGMGHKLDSLLAGTGRSQPGGPPKNEMPAVSGQRAVQPSQPREEPSGVYIISVAARILSMHPQTLRKYERVGLVRPSRTVGMLRLYSEEDIAKLRMIKYLVDEVGLNLAGVDMALAVFDRLVRAREQLATSPAAKVFDQMFQDILALLQGPHAAKATKERE